MILRKAGISIVAFLAAGAIAAQADPARAAEKAPYASESEAGAGSAGGHKLIKLCLVESRETGTEETDREDSAREKPGEEKPGEAIIIDGEAIARDVEEAVGEAVDEAAEALEKIEAEIRGELDGEKLEALSEKYRERLEEAREQLRDVGNRLAEHAADLEGRVAKAGKKAVEAAREAGDALRDTRVIVIRNGEDADIEIETDERGRTVVVIEGGDVKVIGREKPEAEKDADRPPE